MRFNSSHFDSLLLALDIAIFCPDRPSSAVGGANPSATPGQTWHATVGAQTADKGRQALAFLPNEIWIHAGDRITWRFEADDVHTVTFLNATDKRPDFLVGPPNGFTTGSASFDGSTSISTPLLVNGATFTVTFPNTGNSSWCAWSMNA